MPQSKPHATWFWIGLAALLAVAGCARHPYRAAPPLERPELQRNLLASLQGRYPARFRLKQRLALRALGKQYDMIGYLAVEPGGGFRAFAMGEMGGRIFDLAWEKGKAEIRKKPEKMPPNPLLDGVIGDIRHLFTLPEDSRVTLRRDEVGGAFLSLDRGAGTVADFYFNGDGQASHTPELYRSLESDGRRILREAEFSDYRRFPGWDRPLPARIAIRNDRWHYVLEVELLDITAVRYPEVGRNGQNNP